MLISARVIQDHDTALIKAAIKGHLGTVRVLLTHPSIDSNVQGRVSSVEF